MHQYLHFFRGKVFYLPYLDFTLFAGLYNRVAHTRYRLAIWYFGDGQCLVVYLVNLGAYLHHAPPFAIVVFRYVDGASRLEVGVEVEFLFAQVGYGGIAKLVEVMRKYLGRKTYGNPFHSLSEQEREFDG